MEKRMGALRFISFGEHLNPGYPQHLVYRPWEIDS